MVHTDKKRVDAKLNIILESELNRTNIPLRKLDKLMKERNSLEQLRLGTFIAGCVMCFNHKVKEISFPFNNSRMQDSVIAMAVAEKGGIISTIYQPTMLYGYIPIILAEKLKLLCKVKLEISARQ